MIDIGSVIVGPDSREVEVGPFTLESEDNCLWIQVTQISPPQVWNYSFGLLWWESTNGRELGTEKIYGHALGETYRLGNGRSPLEREGRLMFAPRAYNRKWISIETPPQWSLSFAGASGIAGGNSSEPSLGTRATLGSLVDSANTRLTYSINGDYAYIK